MWAHKKLGTQEVGRQDVCTHRKCALSGSGHYQEVCTHRDCGLIGSSHAGSMHSLSGSGHSQEVRAHRKWGHMESMCSQEVEVGDTGGQTIEENLWKRNSIRCTYHWSSVHI